METTTTPNAVKEFSSACIFLILDKDDEVLYVGKSKGGRFNPYRLPAHINFLEGVKMVIKPFATYKDAVDAYPLTKLKYTPQYNKAPGHRPRTKVHVGYRGAREQCEDCRDFGVKCPECPQNPNIIRRIQ